MDYLWSNKCLPVKKNVMLLRISLVRDSHIAVDYAVKQPLTETKPIQLNTPFYPDVDFSKLEDKVLTQL